ncbi:dihydrofolate reductase family protein [Humibacter ginsenosidimutans]|uniref:Deaminase n=1 Tax=Humibacter ginsenosidimutans TaxID=2599293 RepID=A0A5B8M5V7_9MICO|nr:dihydrofolate reductase family protein [Humibacter ginsenosidimutans]QDZ15185.1 deaminase [Humibacter ginsenosidimutans]
MRKIVAYELLSLDGMADDPDRFITEWDGEMQANLSAVIETQDAVILGRRTYDEWAGFWPGSDIQPFSTFINEAVKYVATSRALEPSWANSTAIDGELIAFARELKSARGGDIGVHGSISITQALLAAGLLDELSLVIAPRIAGTGRRLLDSLPSSRLDVIRTATSSDGYLLLRYRAAR